MRSRQSLLMLEDEMQLTVKYGRENCSENVDTHTRKPQITVETTQSGAHWGYITLCQFALKVGQALPCCLS